jgi:uncharacterized protein YbjT (DUF2867 family)
MAAKKIIAVTGATGAQGGGLVRAILKHKDGPFAARAVTRDPNSAKAQELAKLGVEVVAANQDDPPSMRRAFAGAYGAFVVTNFWEHFSVDREIAQARASAEAAKANNLEHVIWSTLEDTRKWVPLSDERMPTLHGKYKVPHFDGKGEADQIFRDLGVPTTFLLTAFYWENFLFFGMGPKRGADGALTLSLPMGDQKLAGLAVDDIGKCAYAIFERGREFINKTVGIVGAHLTGAELAAGMSRALGQPVRYASVPFDVYRGLGFPGADDLGNMFQIYHDFPAEFARPRSVEFSRSLNPEMQSFDDWLARNKSRIPLE